MRIFVDCRISSFARPRVFLPGPRPPGTCPQSPCAQSLNIGDRSSNFIISLLVRARLSAGDSLLMAVDQV